MSSLLSTFSALLSATENASSALQAMLAEKDAAVASLEAQLASARAQREQTAADLAQVTERMADLRARVKELTPPAPPATSGRIWSVSDCHCHCSSGAWALEATESNTYGVCVSSSDKDSANIAVTLHNGQSVPVSKRRMDAAKDIRVGDTLYMGDKKRNAVFKGVVTGRSVEGLFRSADTSVNSFRRRVGEREAAAQGKNDFRSLSDEVEMMWEVNWERVGRLTKAAKETLRYSERRTVRPLQTHPVF